MFTQIKNYFIGNQEENNKLFYQAVTEGDVATVKSYLDQGYDVNLKDNDGYTILHAAVMKLNEKVVMKEDINHEAVIKTQLPVIAAVREKQINLVKLLLERGANPNAYAKNNPYDSILCTAVYSRNSEAIRLLIEKEAKVDFKNLPSRYPDDIKNLLNSAFAKQKNEPEVQNQNSSYSGVGYYTNKLFSLAKNVAEYSINYFTGNQEENIKLFYQAVTEGDEVTVKSYLDQGYDVNLTDNDGHTILYEAVIRKNLPMVTLLIEKGAIVTEDLMFKTDDGNLQMGTALHGRNCTQHTQLIGQLIKGLENQDLKNLPNRCSSEINDLLSSGFVNQGNEPEIQNQNSSYSGIGYYTNKLFSSAKSALGYSR